MARISTKENKNIYQQIREDLQLSREAASELLQFIGPDRIEKIENDGTIVTLKSDAPVTGSQKVFFAYAQVIDNTSSEKVERVI